MPRCPSCFTPLTRAEEDSIKSAVCGSCFGTWISTGSLLRRTQLDVRLANEPSAGIGAEHSTAAALNATSFAELADIVRHSDSREMLRCAACERPMVKERFHAIRSEFRSPYAGILLDARREPSGGKEKIIFIIMRFSP